MIAPEVVAEVRRLLAEGGLSHRGIARLLKVSRATVGAIAHGTRPDRVARGRARREEDSLLPSGPLERCPGCGGMAEMPCRLCRVRAMVARGRMRRPDGRGALLDEPLRVDLRGECRARYEEIRAGKIAAERAGTSPHPGPLPAAEREFAGCFALACVQNALEPDDEELRVCERDERMALGLT